MALSPPLSCLICTDRENSRKDIGTPAKPRHGECATPSGAAGKTGAWTCLGGARLPGQVRSPPLDSASARGAPRTSVPSARSQGAGPAAGTGRPVASLRGGFGSGAPVSSSAPAPRVSPECAVTPGRVIRGPCASVSRDRACEQLCSVVPSPFCLPGGRAEGTAGTPFLPSFPNVWETGSEMHDPTPTRSP